MKKTYIKCSHFRSRLVYSKIDIFKKKNNNMLKTIKIEHKQCFSFREFYTSVEATVLLVV